MHWHLHLPNGTLSWPYILFASLLLAGAAISAGSALLSLKRWHESGVYMFILMTMAMAFWCFAYAMEIFATMQLEKSVWHGVVFVATALLPPAWLSFNLYANDIDTRWIRQLIPIVFLEPLLMIVLIWTNHQHGLIWSEMSFKSFGDYVYIGAESGYAHTVHAAYSYLLVIIGIFLYIRLLNNSPYLSRWHVAAFTLSAAIPVAVSALTLRDLALLGPLDPTPLVITTFGLFAGWCAFRFRATDVLPLVGQTVFDNMHDGMVVLDADDRIVNLNPAAQRQLGCGPNDAHGRTVDYYLHDFIQSTPGELEGQQSQTSTQFTSHFVPPGMPDRYVEIVLNPFFNGNQKLAGRLLVMRDVTRRLRAEQARQESDMHYRSLIELSPDLIVRTDMDGTIRYANRQALEFFGVANMQDVLAHKVYDFLVPEDQSRFVDALMAAVYRGVVESDVYSVSHADGELIPVEVNTTILTNADGASIGLLSIIRDISERQRTEDALRLAQRMEGIGLLAGGVAHDFNNLLTSMIAHNSLAKRYMEDENPARAHMDKSILAAQRAADLTRQLLAYAGKGTLKVEALDVNALIKENQALLETAVAKKTELLLDLTDDSAQVHADCGQIQQILMNLILNAAEALEQNPGTINVSTRVKHFTVSELSHYMWQENLMAGDYVSLQVRDTGPGIDDDTLQRIFDPFFTTKIGGRGLGLSTMLGTIRTHGGSLRVESTPGKGTTFEVLLPAMADTGTEANLPAVCADSSNLLSGTILLVDDDEPVREALADVLRSAGFTVITAVNGRDGLDTFAQYQESIDFVLMDIFMPVMDGNEALNQLRQRSLNVPVLLMSGYTKSGLPEDIASNPRTDFLAKPVTPDSLTQRIEEMLKTAAQLVHSN